MYENTFLAIVNHAVDWIILKNIELASKFMIYFIIPEAI